MSSDKAVYTAREVGTQRAQRFVDGVLRGVEASLGESIKKLEDFKDGGMSLNDLLQSFRTELEQIQKEIKDRGSR
jgi:hypothetical protein